MRSSPHRSLLHRLVAVWLLCSLAGLGVLLPLEGAIGSDWQTAGYGDIGSAQSEQGRPAAACADHCSHAVQHLSGLPAAPLQRMGSAPPALLAWRDETAHSLSPPVPVRPPISR